MRRLTVATLTVLASMLVFLFLMAYYDTPPDPTRVGPNISGQIDQVKFYDWR